MHDLFSGTFFNDSFLVTSDSSRCSPLFSSDPLGAIHANKILAEVPQDLGEKEKSREQGEQDKPGKRFYKEFGVCFIFCMYDVMSRRL